MKMIFSSVNDSATREGYFNAHFSAIAVSGPTQQPVYTLKWDE